jgi:pilus assembly protein FimV
MTRLARWGAWSLLAAPVGAWALGLGDIELKSALNQPFQADIHLVSATREELDALRVTLASNDTFVRYGVDRPGFLAEMQFTVTKDPQGQDIVRVTSRNAVTEPFVTMLVEATWPRGRLLREYTVLLDPPVLLPAPAARVAVTPAETRRTEPTTPASTINRPATAPPPASRAPAPAARPAPATSSPASAPTPPGSYGPVQRGETLWGISSRLQPSGVTMNQIMLAIYRANPAAFDGNMNLLRRGAVLEIPASGEMASLTARAAMAEAQRQYDAWQGRDAQQARLRLVPPTEGSTNAGASQSSNAGAGASSTAATARLQNEVQSLRSDLEESQRLLRLRDDQLRDLQTRLSAPAEAAPAAAASAATAPDAPAAGPGVDLESEPLFADEVGETPAAEIGAGAEATPPVETAPTPPPPAPSATRSVVTTPAGPSLVDRVLGWVMNPLLLIGLGVAAVLAAALWYVRRRREDIEDVTGRWEALEAEVDEDDSVKVATARLRRQVPEDTGVVVVEQPARRTRSRKESAADVEAAGEETEAGIEAEADHTVSSQTIINLDQADALAEADFHMAYGLYDQAAELISKALEAEPRRRDLKLKLLEVFFVWGNKESFLETAQSLRAGMGQKPDADWDKVIIMGKQICPEESLFASAKASAAAVDLDLDAGESPALDLNLESREESGFDVDFGFTEDEDAEVQQDDARLEATANEPRGNLDEGEEEDVDLLDIGARTAAGLQTVFVDDLGDDADASARTTPDLVADSLAVTQESPTIESPRAPTMRSSRPDLSSEAPTVEAPRPKAPQAPHTGIDGTSELPTIEQPRLVESDHTAEIDLDDLGLDVDELGDLPADEDTDLNTAADLEGTGTMRRPNRDLLSESSITKVLEGDEDVEHTATAVISDKDATLLAPGFDEDTLSGTEVLEQIEDSPSGTQQFRMSEDGLDLNLEDLSAALDGGETVEQPSNPRFTEVFGGNGRTPVDLDVGLELSTADDPTGTEELDQPDPQTLTEVGTKLDLARAYIDMGDPEGARSILEEVLDEGDAGQRREAQSLIDVLRA